VSGKAVKQTSGGLPAGSPLPKGQMNKLQPLLPARIEQGKILFRDPLPLSKILSQYNSQDVNVSIKPLRNNRSDSQNRYYWGVVVSILSDHTGYSRDEIHEILRGKFLSDSKSIAGEDIRYSHSTTELDTLEFEDYLQKIREWASVKFEIFIPLPNEVDY